MDRLIGYECAFMLMHAEEGESGVKEDTET